ncbi:hypothetical protein ACVWZV_004440 [Bradyrhizobium sp. GM5.1]
MGELTQLDAQFGIRPPTRAVSDHLAVGADDRAGPPFRQAEFGLQMRDSLALGGGPYH